MMLTSDNETLAENKILILYILNKLGKSISGDSLLDLILTVTDMNYFYFQQFLLDLLAKNYIVNLNKEDSNLYMITDEGKQALLLTQDMLPGIMKLKVDSDFKTELGSIEDKQSVIAEYIPVSEKDYTVSCKIIDNNDTIFEVKTFAGSREKAKEIVDNWNENANKMYPAILEILTNKNTGKKKKK